MMLNPKNRFEMIILQFFICVLFCSTLCEPQSESAAEDESESRISTPVQQGADSESDNLKVSQTPLQKYKYLFSHHRSSQLEAVKRIVEYEDNTRRYDLVNMMLKQIFKTTEEAKNNVTSWGFLPGDPFPENITVLESVTKIYENTALFGDMVLRLPDVVHNIYDHKKDWQLLVAWAYGFCTQSNVFEGPNSQLLNLMAQEVKIIPEDPNYFNPFKAVNKEKAKQMLEEKAESEKVGKKKPKKKIQRGPRISRTEL